MHVSDIDASDCGKYKKISDAFGGPTRRPRKWQFPSQVETGEGAEQGAFWFVVSMGHIQCGQKLTQ